MKKKLAIAFFFSGAAALVYQVLWARMLGLVFGNTTYAVSTVLAAFMGGMALGSYFMGRYAEKSGAGPLKTLAYMEAAVGLYCALTPLLFAAAGRGYILAQQSFELSAPAITMLRFVFSSAILLFPTFMMGGTLPVMTKALKAILPSEELSGAIGFFYGLNTLGAVFGVIFSAFISIAYFGVGTTLYLAVAANLAVAAFLYGISRSEKDTSPVPEAEVTTPAADQGLARLALAAAAISGFSAMVCEVVWSRSLSMVIGMSVYAFATMLAAFLAGMAAGSFVFVKFAEKRVKAYGNEGFLAVGVMLGAAGVLILTTIPVFNHLPLFFLRLFGVLSGSFASLLLLQVLISFLVMVVPAAFFGLMFPMLIKIYTLAGSSSAKNSSAVGRIYASNTAGCIAGSLLAGFALVSLLGLEGSIRASGFVCVTAALVILLLAKDMRRLALPMAAFLSIAAAPHLLSVGAWDSGIMNSGVYQYAPDIIKNARAQGVSVKEAFKQAVSGEELYSSPGANFTVAVTRNPNGVLSLSIDGKVDASSNIFMDMQTQTLSGHLPLLLHPGAKRVLVIGLASGVTLGAVGAYPGVEEIDCVEIEPAMTKAASFFSPWNRGILKDKRVNLIVNDGRNYLLAAKKKYDVIISVPSNPWIPGSSALFTEEFFKLAKNSLATGGVFCQWVQAYELRLDEVRSVAAAAAGVFPELSLWNPMGGDLLLVSAEGKFPVDYQTFTARFAAAAPELAKVRIKDPLDVLARFLMGGDAINGFVKGARPNTDDRPLLEYSAPKYIYTVEVSKSNLDYLLKNASSVSGSLVNFSDSAKLAARYMEKNLPAQAEKEVLVALARKDDAADHNLLGEAYLKQGKAAAAAEQFEKALALKPSYSRALVNLSVVYMDTDPEKALEYAGKASGAAAYTQAGLVQLKRGKPAEAARSFEKARKSDPSYMPAYINGAVVYLDYLDIPPAALEILDAGTKMNRNVPELYYHAGRALYRMGFAGEALSNFNRAVAMNPAYEKHVKEAVEKINRLKG